MSNEEIIARLLEFDPLLNIEKFWVSAFRDISFNLLLGIKGFVDALGEGVSQMYQLMNFWDSQAVRNFIDPYRPVVISLMTLAMLWIAFRLIGDPKKDKQKIVNNILMAILMFVGLPFFMGKAGELVSAGREGLQQPSEATLQIFKDNITDLYTIDKQGWQYPTNDVGVNDIQKVQNLNLLDISEKVDTDLHLFKESPLSKEGKETLTKKVLEVNGEAKLAKMKGITKWDEYYYRYSWHPWYILLELLAYGLVLVFTIFKTGKICYEIGVMRVLGYGVTLTDLENGQRNKTLLFKIRDSFIVLYLLSVLLNIFVLYMTTVKELSLEKPWDIIAILAGAMAAIDGPNIVEQLFGIDAGLSSVGRSLVGFTQSSMAATSAGKAMASGVSKSMQTAKSVGGKAIRGATNTGAGLGGLLKGFKGGPLPEDGASTGPKAKPEKTTQTNGTKDNPPTAGNKENTEPNHSPEPKTNLSANGFGEEGTPSGGNGEQSTPPMITDPKEAANLLNDLTGAKPDSTGTPPKLGEGAGKATPANDFSKNGVKKQVSVSPGHLAAYQAGNLAEQPEPKANPATLPMAAKEARARLERDLSTPSSDDTFKDAMVDKYISTRQNLAQTKLVRGGVRSYELGKNTGEKWRDKP
ncbi:pLS20_p028 family conjugation system transmembrane protein [Enterococcus sp. AZ129]|uniref:pLS20_p028 family conjugation system transmembrane protein n=1 Tax=unclassified Enterococcus TaxID=2608891 RepID=UPI003F202A7F